MVQDDLVQFLLYTGKVLRSLSNLCGEMEEE